MPEQPDTATVIAARAGDPAAVDHLVAGYLPLVYTIVGRALDGHADVDDVVQEVMLRVLRNLGDLREPEAFRSWLVAIAVRQVRERYRTRRGGPDVLLPDDVRDPGADFTDLAITRLELSGQRRETAEATRWLDEENRELLSLWWLEASGELTRDEIVAALGVTRQHAAVRVQRMKGQLETARVVVRALAASPLCPELRPVLVGWDGHPTGLWRKRIARHTRDCRTCAPAWNNLVAAERLLAGMALIPAPFGAEHVAGQLAGQLAGLATGGGKALTLKTVAAKTVLGMSRRMVTATLATTTVAGGGAAVVIHQQHEATPPVRAAAVAATPTTIAPSPIPSSPAPTPKPSASKPKPKPATKAAAPAPKAISAKKGVGTWAFAGNKAAMKDVGASWFYTWASNDDVASAPAGVEFVPMIRAGSDATDARLAEAKREGDGTLLAFNEPDMQAQANMSVADALAAWPRLEKTGVRLGSPAVAWGGDQQGEWLDRFMTGARQKNLRVDFITLHWYGSDFGPAAVNHFLGYVDAVHRRYGKPIWVTEYGLINWSGSPKYATGEQYADFITGTTAGLEKRSFVERYAWFGLPAIGDSTPYGLYTAGNSPTEAGRAYRAAG
ncbi:sigma-70 family RNA polymerase sigma factor [Actinoplanes sp. NPDC051633]|uniref:sigma-70 family RNA polymerase sigma factor n=1 Tax=Actinoplanes sp. NPDC051633 TaxID=3155670 RepID=UPI003436E7B5